MSRLTFTPHRRLVALAVSLAAALVGAAPASATIVERLDLTGSGSTVIALCGLSIRVDSASTTTGRIRAGTGDDATAFFLQYRSRSLDVYTNLANNRYFTIEAGTLTNETQATRVAGSLFEFVSVQAGQPFVVRDSSGTVVLRDRGAIRTRVLFDTGGDNVPGGETVAVLGVEVNGPHPSLGLDEASTCAGVHELIG